MKQWLKSLGCTALILCLLAGVTACGKNDQTTSSDPGNDTSVSDSSDNTIDPTDPSDPGTVSDDNTQNSGDSHTSGTPANPNQSGNKNTTTRNQSSGNTSTDVAPAKLRGTKLE